MAAKKKKPIAERGVDKARGKGPKLGTQSRSEAVTRPTSKRLTKKNLEDYLTGLAEWGTGTAGCRNAGIGSESMRQYIDRHPEFLDLETAAREEYRDSLFNEMTRRGRDGVEEPVFGAVYREVFFDHEGNQIPAATIPDLRMLPDGVRRVMMKDHGVVGYVRKYSDRLLERLATGLIPELNPVQKVESTVDAKVNSEVKATVDFSKMTPEERAALRVLLKPAAKKASSE